MLDRTAYKILGILASMSTKGENLVVQKDEILSLLDVELTAEELNKIIEALEVNDLIVKLYSDESMYCVAMMPKGELIADKNKKAEEAALAAAAEEAAEEAKITASAPAVQRKEEEGTAVQQLDVRRFAVICAVSSFLGGFVAALITFLVTLFR